MKLFFDARFTRHPRHDGISRYGAQLLTALLGLTRGNDIEVVALVCEPEQLTMLPEVEHVLECSPMSPAELTIARRLNARGADVVFSTMQTMGSAGRDYALVLTLHDLIYYRHPEPPHDLPAVVRGVWRLYHKAYWPQRFMLDRADAVAAVSETTKGLIEEHALTKRPVHVVSNAGDALDVPPREENRAGARSLVYMGAFLPYKNVEALIRALEFLPGWTLHLASRIEGKRRAELSALVPDRARVVFHDGVSDEEYHALLEGATALVTASLDEGFGLPVVEALSRAVPVAVSDLPIFHELAAEHAEYFDPEDPASVAEAALRLAEPATWAARSAAGPAQAATFSWEESARRLLALARELHAERNRSTGASADRAEAVD